MVIPGCYVFIPFLKCKLKNDPSFKTGEDDVGQRPLPLNLLSHEHNKYSLLSSATICSSVLRVLLQSDSQEIGKSEYVVVWTKD